MKRLKRLTLYISLIMLFISMGSFMFLNPIEENSVSAYVSGVSGAEITLTGQQGTQPSSYFTDIDENSTLVDATVVTEAKTYTNAAGEETSLYYSIQGSSTKKNGGRESYGYCDFVLSNKMQTFADAGILYVQASAGVASLDNDGNDKIIISVSNNGVKKDQVSSGEVAEDSSKPEWISTEFIQVVGDTIGYKFCSNNTGNVYNKCRYYLYEPKLVFKLILADGEEKAITFDDSDTTVVSGGTKKLNANTIITRQDMTVEYYKYYASIHRISYEIIEGKNYASIIDGTLWVDENTPENTEIKIQAKCKSDSNGDEYLYSDIVTYVVKMQRYKVTIESDFKNYGSIYGAGEYLAGKKITLSTGLAKGYNFVNWEIKWEEEEIEEIPSEVEGEPAQIKTKTVAKSQIVTKSKYILTINKDYTIKCNLTKTIELSNISAETRVYDGTTKADIVYTLTGVEEEHEVNVVGAEVKYVSANASENQKLIISGYPEIVGRDIGLYILNITCDANNLTGKILPYNIDVKANAITKTYGDVEEKISYTCSSDLIGNDTLKGSLARESGENVGEYEINIGTLQSENTNYKINFTSNTYTIQKRKVELEIDIKDKTYDKTNAIEYTAKLKNKIDSDDLDIDIDLVYSSNNVGKVKIDIKSLTLIGSAKDNYELEDFTEEVFGIITKKTLVITPNELSKVFGDSDPELTYKVDGLLDGDELTGSLSRESGENVDTYSIIINTLDNPNYDINLNDVVFTITKRAVTITANEISKVYGELDPEFTYIVKNAVEGEKITGKLSRDEGENVGIYKLTQGSINNSNYEIEFITNNLTIVKRQVMAEIRIKEKVYDGTTIAEYESEFTNLLSEDENNLVFSAIFNFKSENVGNNIAVEMTEPKLTGISLENYDIVMSSELKGNILRKEVKVTLNNIEKVYGENDKEFTYSVEGLINGEELVGELEREEGENAGKYEIVNNTVNNASNPNYEIKVVNIAYLTINPAPLIIKAIDAVKIFGEDDPEFTYEILSNGMKYDDKIEDNISGKMDRESGNNPGKYIINKGNISTSNNYYISEFRTGSLIIQKRKIELYVDNAEKVYGEEDPKFTFTTENTIDGYAVTISFKRDYGEDVGDYTITYQSLNDQRYDISFHPAILTINPYDIKVKADKRYKQYGDTDPKYSVSVVEGKLQNGDAISEIECGQMTREEGEQIGLYVINQGDYSLGQNYNIVFESGELEIIQAELVIQADKLTKKYGNLDNELTYTIIEGKVSFNDKFEGKLIREEGENIGVYEISQGTLSINENYNMTFKGATFTIEKRALTITADAASKFYGEEDPEFTYALSEPLCNNDILDGCLSRKTASTEEEIPLYETTARYPILSTLSNPNYDITYIENYLTIKQRVINIKANNVSKMYREEDPELTYVITGGEILEGDEISGNIYRISGENVGRYDIRSNLTLGRNYKIKFEKGVFEILPIDIYIQTYDYEKIYGENNPDFEYEILNEEDLQDEKLLGGVSKENGEGVGKYKLISAFNNTNFNIILSENYLTIKPKEAVLNLSIQDKVYDGTTVAYIKQPVVTGLIDSDIIIAYDKENCARFATSEVGDHISVSLYNIVLQGKNAENYTLIYPTEVYGNITYNELATENNEVALVTDTNTNLTYGSILNAERNTVDASNVLTPNKQLVTTYTIQLSKNDKNTEIKDTLSVKINIPLEYRDRRNFYVYGYNKNNELVLLASEMKDGYLVFTTDNLGDFIILTDNEMWLDICLYVSIGLIAIMIIIFIIRAVKKHKKKKMLSKI